MEPQRLIDEEIRREAIEFELDYEVEDGFINIETDPLLSKKATNPSSVVCFLQLKITYVYPRLDSNQYFESVTNDLAHIPLVDYDKNARPQIVQEFGNLGIHNPTLHQVVFRLLDIHHSQLLSDEYFSSSHKHQGNKRRFLEIKLNIIMYGQYNFGDDKCRLIPTAKSAIDRLENLEVESLDALSKRDNCTICFKGIHTERFATKLPCKHIFHEVCAIKWLQTSHFCPLCRFEMPVDE